MSNNTHNTTKSSVAAFDPYASENLRQTQPYTSSLLDDSTDDERSVALNDAVRESSSQIPGAANYLEIEREPPRSSASSDNDGSGIQTTSGLLLTHRKSNTQRYGTSRDEYVTIEEEFGEDNRTPGLHEDDDDNVKKRAHSNSLFGSGASLQRLQMNVEHYYQNPSHGWNDLRYLLKYTRFGILMSAAALVLGTTYLMHHWMSGASATRTTTATTNSDNVTDRVILMPLPVNDYQQQQQVYYAPPLNQPGGYHRHLSVEDHAQLQQDFDQWVFQHRRQYDTPQEKHFRFQVWLDNHVRTDQKNARHGPCRLSRQPVFGKTLFSDLTPQEFQQHYLTGYHGPRHDELLSKPLRAPRANLGVLGQHAPRHHPSVQGRHIIKGPQRQTYAYKCKWWDLSCTLTYLYDRFFYGLGTTMEPAYDADSYPTAVDWRAAGAVTDVHSQGNCGACWAIGAIETIESAVFLNGGSLYDLSESEVIVCSEECEMCYGGWPQDAFDYVADHGGIPLEDDLPYDGDYLLELTKAMKGESSNYDEDSLESYREQVCPNKQGGSKDDNNGGGQYLNTARYGKIEGYGYATERCTCYSDGSGCDCDAQNEGLAVRNLATYGPAVVCVDAANWQDYNGGIITSASGCSQEFMDVNHCVQVVGYAFADANDGGGGQQGSHDGSGSKDDDNSDRQGYWIVRNQWSQYWGMSGYAYVAMGENTCGILNDMVQVYA